MSLRDRLLGHGTRTVNMVLSLRSTPLWMLGYPEAALAGVDQALKDAREIGHAASLMYALAIHRLSISPRELCGSKRAS